MCPKRRETPPGPKATDVLAAQLREQILNGALEAGTPLREQDLANQHGLSRHTVRTALAALASERLLELEAYRGARVRTFDIEAAVALQQLRGALEAEAVRVLNERHGSHWPAEVRAPIEASLLALADADARGDWAATTRAHSRVHVSLVESAGSPRVTEAYRLLESETLLLLTQLRLRYPAGALEPQHRDYLEAVQHSGGDAVRAHLQTTIDLVRATAPSASAATSAPARR